MTTLLAFLWTPVIATALALGVGLLVERLGRWRTPAALLAPVGAATAIAVTTAVYRLHGTAIVAALVIGAAAVAGFLMARGELRERLRPGPAAAAALAVYLLYLGPVLASGHWSWPGYNFVNDTSVNLLYVDLLAHHGYQQVGADSLSTRVQSAAVIQSYPMGVHGLIATLGPFTWIDAAAIYQPFLATLGAGAAAAFGHIARRAGAIGWVAATMAVFAAGANLTYQDALHGGIKEIATVLLIATVAAIVAEALATGLRHGVGAALALCLTSIILVLSVGGAPYAALGAVLAGVALVAGTGHFNVRRLAAATGVGVVVAALAVAPVMGDVLAFAKGAGSSFEAGKGGEGVVTIFTYGQLVRPLPLAQAAGIWFAEDYRFPVGGGKTELIQYGLIALIAALAVVGAVAGILRRRLGLPLLLVACGLAVLLVAPRVSPYAAAKLLAILSPAVVLSAGAGAWWLWTQRQRVARVAAVGLAVACGAAVLYSDAIAAHQVRLAPQDRMEALEDAADHAGRGYWLLTEWEEFGKYFARGIRSSSGSESESPDVVTLRKEEPRFGNAFDLDEQALEYVQRFDGVIVRRSPVASRPPGEYRLAYLNEYYEVWRRDPSAPRALEHLPLGDAYDAAGVPSCTEVTAMAKKARAEGAMLLAAPHRPSLMIDVAKAPNRPLGWVPVPSRPRSVTLNTPGRLAVQVDVPEQGRYRVWLQLSSGRDMKVSVNGQPIGAVHQVNSPEAWLEAGEVSLPPGTQVVELLRGGGRPKPGDGYVGELGPVVLERVGQDGEPVRVSPSTARAGLCGKSWDWIETVR